MVRRTGKKRERIREIMRRQGILKRKSFPQAEVLEKSRKIMAKLLNQEEFIEAETVMFYMAKNGEVETKEMIKEALRGKKRVVIPEVKEENLIPKEIKNLSKDLKKGSFGIMEPKGKRLKIVPVKEIDLVVVPGIFADLKKHRLGYGRGYFDRFLSHLSKGKKTIGLFFDSQIVKKLPAFEHDRALDRILTEKRIIT